MKRGVKEVAPRRRPVMEDVGEEHGVVPARPALGGEEVRSHRAHAAAQRRLDETALCMQSDHGGHLADGRAQGRVGAGERA